jgi:hypothetical protein
VATTLGRLRQSAHDRRHRASRDGSVSQLAVVVLSPRLDLPVGEQSSGEVAGRRDGCRSLQPRDQDRDPRVHDEPLRVEGVSRRAMTAPPTGDSPGLYERAGVAVGRGDRERGGTFRPDRVRPGFRRCVADPAAVVDAPAPWVPAPSRTQACVTPTARSWALVGTALTLGGLVLPTDVPVDLSLAARPQQYSPAADQRASAVVASGNLEDRGRKPRHDYGNEAIASRSVSEFSGGVVAPAPKPPRGGGAGVIRTGRIRWGRVCRDGPGRRQPKQQNGAERFQPPSSRGMIFGERTTDLNGW